MTGKREGGFTFDLGSPIPGSVQGEGDGSFDPSPNAPLGSDSDVGHLDLDLSDLGLALRAKKTPAPASVAGHEAPPSEAQLTGAPAPERLFRRETRLGSTPWGAFSRAEAEDRAAPKAPSTAAAASSAAPIEVAPNAPTDQATPRRTATETAANAPERTAAEHLEPELTLAEAQPGPRELPGAPPDEAPRVKKVVFPARAPQADTTQADGPQPNALQADTLQADAHQALTEREPAAPENPTAAPFLEPPLDLPEELRAPRPAPLEAPSPQALWRLTRELWRGARRRATALGRASAARSLSLADEAKGVWRRRKLTQPAPPPADQLPHAPRASEPPPLASEPPGASFPVPARPAPRSSWGTRLARQLAPPALTVGVAALVYVAGSHVLGVTDAVSLSRAKNVPHLGSLPAAEQSEPPRAAAPGAAAPGDPAPRGAQPASASSGPRVENAPFPADLSYPGKGLIEVVTREDELIYVNGVFVGRGPLRRVPVNPGEHAVSIRSGGSEQKSDLRVDASQTTRVLFVPLPAAP